MKRLADILLSLAALLLLAACTDDADVYNTPASSEGNLCVYVPVTREGDEVTSSLDPSNPTYNASVDECKINDLHLYAFPVDGNGTFLSQELPSPEASNMLNENVASYRLKIKPGTYRVYVVANMKDVLDVNSITTEGDLKNVVLSYRPMSKPGMPVANNIPMISEPDTKAADGSTVNGTITIKNTDTTPQTVVANLRFTCVKVCLNLIYNPDDPDMNAALKSNGLQITDIMGKQLSPQTSLLWDGKFTNQNVSDDYAKGIESSLYNATAHTGNGAYYTSWTETPANANVNNDDIISVEGEGVAAPANSKEKWLFRATYYLPERYVAQASQQSALKIGGAVGGSAIKNSYNINLGHHDESSTSEVPTFPRGTYYEIVGRIKSLGNIDLDCVVGVEPWQMPIIDVDLNHTTLWVSKTSAEVPSSLLPSRGLSADALGQNSHLGCHGISNLLQLFAYSYQHLNGAKLHNKLLKILSTACTTVAPLINKQTRQPYQAIGRLVCLALELRQIVGRRNRCVGFLYKLKTAKRRLEEVAPEVIAILSGELLASANYQQKQLVSLFVYRECLCKTLVSHNCIN